MTIPSPSMIVVERYARRLQMSPDTQMLGILGFLAEHSNGADPAGAADNFFAFLGSMKRPDSWGVQILCYMVDLCQEPSAFLRYFEGYAQTYEDARMLPVPVVQTPVQATVQFNPQSPVKPQVAQVAEKVATVAPTGPPPPSFVPTNQAVTTSLDPPITTPKPSASLPVVNVAIAIPVEDYWLIGSRLTGPEAKEGNPGDVVRAYQAPVPGKEGYMAHLELTMGPAGMALDGYVTHGRRSQTANAVYKLDEKSIVQMDGKEFHLWLEAIVK